MKKFFHQLINLLTRASDALYLPQDYTDQTRSGRHGLLNSPSLLSRVALIVLLILSIVLFMFPTILLSQSPETAWVKSIGASGMQRGMTLVEGPQGNIYVAGEFQGTVDFDPGPGEVYLQAIVNRPFIQKLSSTGDLVWVKAIEASTGGMFSIDVDQTGNVYMGGAFTQSGDFDPDAGTAVLNSNGQKDGFILKLDQTGAFLWAKQIGGTQYDDLNTLVLDDDANIYVTGRFDSLVDFDPGNGFYEISAAGSSDGYVLKLDSDGNFKWVSQIEGLGSSMLTNQSMAIDSESNLLLTGSFFGTADLDPGVGEENITSNGNRDVFVLKLDVDGSLEWARAFGGGASDHTQSIAVDGNDYVYVYGTFAGNVDFDPGPGTDILSPTSGGSDAFVVKLDDDGEYKFARILNAEGVTNLKADDNQNIYLAGAYNGTTDFDPGAAVYNVPSTSQTFDAFVLKLDLNGEFQWVANASGEGTDIVQGIILTQDGGILTTGSFEDTTDFDPEASTTLSLTSLGDEDAFFWKLGESTPTQITVIDSGHELNVFPNPVKAGSNITVSGLDAADQYMINIYDPAGREAHESFSANSQSVQLASPMTGGVYTIRMTNAEGKEVVSRLVVE